MGGEMTKKRNLWKRTVSFIESLREDQWLCCATREKKTGEREMIYFIEPGGREVAPGTAAQAISSGLLQPANDGLFGPEFSQSWRRV